MCSDILLASFVVLNNLLTFMKYILSQLEKRIRNCTESASGIATQHQCLNLITQNYQFNSLLSFNT